jgi:hypothetical protein
MSTLNQLSNGISGVGVKQYIPLIMIEPRHVDDWFTVYLEFMQPLVDIPIDM